jgi:hypothetical protein
MQSAFQGSLDSLLHAVCQREVWIDEADGILSIVEARDVELSQYLVRLVGLTVYDAHHHISLWRNER